MKKSLLFLLALAMSPAAFAKQPTKQPNQQPINESQRVSVTGAVFTRDTSMPALGEAYKDPSGVIWGDVVTNSQGEVKFMTEYNAEKYCASIGARLPTIEEFEQLAMYLGHNTDKDYNPYLADGKTEILPGLAENWFWSRRSTLTSANRYYAWVFVGDGGYVLDNFRNNTDAVRCVGR